MRLDEEKLREVDGWRARQDDVPSRSEAIRRLIDQGLLGGGSELRFTKGETLVVHMLCDLFKALKIKSDFDPNFIQSTLLGGHLWGLEWKYSGTFHDHLDSKEVRHEVVDVLDMWDFIESGYEALSAKKKTRVADEAEPFGKNPKFSGFDGNNETEHLGIARFLIDDLERFSRFKGRDLNSHMQSLDGYRRMLQVFLPMRETLVGVGLADTQIIEILNARAHPDYRKGKGTAK